MLFEVGSYLRRVLFGAKAEVVFLLGSGVSFPAGVPNISSLDEKVKEGAYRYIEGKGYVPSCSRQPDTQTASVQTFVQHLYKYVSDALRESGGKSANYEDVYYLAEKLTENIEGLRADPLGQGTTQILRSQTEDLVQKAIDAGVDTEGSDTGLAAVGRAAQFYIGCVVRHELSGFEPEPEDYQPLVEVLKHPEIRVDSIVTLNHDTLLENLLEQGEVPYEDGFQNVIEDEVEYGIYDPNRFGEGSDSHLHLLKPHGSISWWLFGGRGVTRYIRASAQRPPDELTVEDTVIERFPKPSVLTSFGKEESYLNDIFLDMQDEFARSLRRVKRVVVSGYGFGDRGVNRRLQNWLRRDSENRLVILHADGFGLVAGNFFWQSDNWKTEQIEVIRNHLCSADPNALKRQLLK